MRGRNALDTIGTEFRLLKTHDQNRQAAP